MKRVLIIISIILLGFLVYFNFFNDTEKSLTQKDFQIIKTGDIIFQTSLSEQSIAIQKATNSIYSHVGVIYEDQGQFLVYEANQYVKSTPINEWISNGKDHHFVIKRLKNSEVVLNDKVIQLMKQISANFNNKPYDKYFEWSDQRIYCSELVWKIYKLGTGLELGNTEAFNSLDLSSPEVKSLLDKRYGDSIPLEEKIITPVAMFNSDHLEVVMEN